MPVQFTSREISQKYNRFARWYDFGEGIIEVLGLRRLRQRLIQRASGRVLEVAVGTGKNLRYYREGSPIIAVDSSGEMLNIARKRAAKLSMDVFFLLADAEALPFHEKSFDTVVSSLITCTFPNPVSALREMARVCKPGGEILLLEHGRSDREWLGRWQDRHEDNFATMLGCHWNREPLSLVRETGLRTVSSERNFLEIFHKIEARPQHRDRDA